MMSQAHVEDLLLKNFGMDMKSPFFAEKWNLAWNPIQVENEAVVPQKQESEFQHVEQKFATASDYYLGRETTEQDANENDNIDDAWTSLKKHWESKNETVQKQRNHFGSGPERDLEFAQASILPSKLKDSTRACSLSLGSSASYSYVISTQNASWDITDGKGWRLRKEVPAFLKSLHTDELFEFFRVLLETRNLKMEPVSSFQIKKLKGDFGDLQKDFVTSNGFCIKDGDKYVTYVTCSYGMYDCKAKLKLTEDDAIDCSYLPFYGSNFSEEDTFNFVSKEGLLLFVSPSESESESFLTSILLLVLMEANAEEDYVSACIAFSAGTNETAKEHICQSVGFLDSEIVECDVSLFRIFPTASQALGSAMLLWKQFESQSKTKSKQGGVSGGVSVIIERGNGNDYTNTNASASASVVSMNNTKSRKVVKKEDDSLTTIENSAERFDRSVDMWRGSVGKLRSQLVEE